jgi:hypothetical protein
MTCSGSVEAAARAPMKLNDSPQEGHRASNNRSLLISLEHDSNTSGVSGERIHRRAKHTLVSVPDTERAELSDDIEFSERPPGVLSSPNVGFSEFTNATAVDRAKHQ